MLEFNKYDVLMCNFLFSTFLKTELEVVIRQPMIPMSMNLTFGLCYSTLTMSSACLLNLPLQYLES